jgi:hypothetical protein
MKEAVFGKHSTPLGINAIRIHQIVCFSSRKRSALTAQARFPSPPLLITTLYLNMVGMVTSPAQGFVSMKYGGSEMPCVPARDPGAAVMVSPSPSGSSSCGLAVVIIAEFRVGTSVARQSESVGRLSGQPPSSSGPGRFKFNQWPRRPRRPLIELEPFNGSTPIQVTPGPGRTVRPRRPRVTVSHGPRQAAAEPPALPA